MSESHGWAITGDGYYAEATKGCDTVCIQDGMLTVTEDVGSGYMRQTSTVHMRIEALTALLARAGLVIMPASQSGDEIAGNTPDQPENEPDSR